MIHEHQPQGTERPLRGAGSRLPLVVALATLAVFGTVDSGSVLAQSSDQVGQAIMNTCGEVEPTDGVIAGTVRDATSQVPLDGAAVAVNWQIEGDPLPTTDAVRADGQGFYVFCRAPGGVEVELAVEVLGVSAPTRRVTVEPGTLAVERFEIELSDPSAPGFVTGQVIDLGTGNPIANAQINVPELGTGTLSNEGGLFRLDEMPYGVYEVQVEHIAYSPRTVPIRVAGGLTHNVEIALSENVIELGGISVTVEPKRFYLDREGLIQRMNLGFGDFFTRAEIERLSTSSVAELVARTAGVRVYNNGTGLYIRGRACIPLVFIDGRPWKLDDRLGLKELNTFDADAVEFYKGTASIPAEFNYSTNATDQVGCGALVIWTRRGRD